MNGSIYPTIEEWNEAVNELGQHPSSLITPELFKTILAGMCSRIYCSNCPLNPGFRREVKKRKNKVNEGTRATTIKCILDTEVSA